MHLQGGSWRLRLALLLLLSLALFGQSGVSASDVLSGKSSEQRTLNSTESPQPEGNALVERDPLLRQRLLRWRRSLTDSAPSLFVDNNQSSGKKALFWGLGFFFCIMPFFCVCYGLCSLICCQKHRRRAATLRLQREQLAAGEVGTQMTPPEVQAAIFFADLELGTLVDVGKTPRLNDECPICLKDFTDDDKVRQLPACRHSFHLECIGQWVRKQHTCPLCRTLLLPKLPQEGPADVRDTYCSRSRAS